MSTLLTVVVKRAVPSMHVESAEIVREPRGLYWIRVTPNHILYWYWFRKIYPQWSRTINKYVLKGVEQEFDRTCPEFFRREDLIKWLSETVGLSEGVRKLLQIYEGC
ncbi:hypothetical protein DRN32_01690 [Thermococci archaeon]|nr:MAG: hypothetical protein DRN32_01690 [Thermococci archaeon]